MKERINFIQNRVIEWDVINHPIAWGGADMLNKRPGLEKLDREVFTLSSLAYGSAFFRQLRIRFSAPVRSAMILYIYLEKLKRRWLQGSGSGQSGSLSRKLPALARASLGGNRSFRGKLYRIS